MRVPAASAPSDNLASFSSPQLRFSNQYFKLLLSRKWEPKKWDGPFQYETKVVGQELMML